MAVVSPQQRRQRQRLVVGATRVTEALTDSSDSDFVPTAGASPGDEDVSMGSNDDGSSSVESE